MMNCQLCPKEYNCENAFKSYIECINYNKFIPILKGGWLARSFEAARKEKEKQENSEILQTKYQALNAHMESCRAILNVPNDETLAVAIQELKKKNEEMRLALIHCFSWFMGCENCKGTYYCEDCRSQLEIMQKAIQK